MAEEDLNTSLRVKHMIQIDTATVTADRVTLPADWVELDFVRQIDGDPLHFRTRDQFYRTSDGMKNKNSGYYTIVGNYLAVGNLGDDGREVEISYFQNIPPLTVDVNWLMQYYSRLYVSSTMAVASMYGFEDERGVKWEAEKTKTIEQLNLEYLRSKASGSILKVPKRNVGFG
jgi:hypothetical protein